MRASRVIPIVLLVVAAALVYFYRDALSPAGDRATGRSAATAPATRERLPADGGKRPSASSRPQAELAAGAAAPESRPVGAAPGSRPPGAVPGSRPPGAVPGSRPPGAAPGSGPRAAAPESRQEAVVEEAAHEFIETLTEPQAPPVPIDRADNFVVPEQVVSLPSKRVVELLTPEQILSDPDLGPDSPITLVKEVPQVEFMTPERIIAESGGDLERPLRILENEQVREVTVRQALIAQAANPGSPISVVKLAEYLETTTLRALRADPSLRWDTMVRVIREPYRLQSTTIADLLAGLQDVAPDSIFYIRTVRGSDVQGVWGIIHDGLIKNFARGMAIRRGQEIDTYKVEIPRYADEILPDRSSSFLGKLIDEKARKSAVYNFREGRMTINPDLITPGSEILIVNFTPNELVGIYKHFLSRGG